jgi:hypothetical protein
MDANLRNREWTQIEAKILFFGHLWFFQSTKPAQLD